MVQVSRSRGRPGHRSASRRPARPAAGDPGGRASTGHQRTSRDSALATGSAAPGAHGGEPDVEVLPAAPEVADEDVPVEVRPDRAPGPGRRCPDSSRHSRAAAGTRRRPLARGARRTGTTSGLAVQGEQDLGRRRRDSTRQDAVRCAGGPALAVAAGWAARCSTNSSRAAPWAASGRRPGLSSASASARRWACRVRGPRRRPQGPPAPGRMPSVSPVSVCRPAGSSSPP